MKSVLFVMTLCIAVTLSSRLFANDVGEATEQIPLGTYRSISSDFKGHRFTVSKWAEEVALKASFLMVGPNGMELEGGDFMVVLEKITGNMFRGASSFSFRGLGGAICTGNLEIEIHAYTKGAYIKQFAPEKWTETEKGCIGESPAWMVHHDPYFLVGS